MKYKFALYLLASLLFLNLLKPALASADNPNPEVPPVMKVNSSCVKQVSPDVQITNWFFGLFDYNPRSGQYTYRSAEKVPLVVNQEFGFRINMQTSKKSVDWNYAYELPKPLPTWPNTLKGLPVTFSPDYKIVYLKGSLPGPNSVLEEIWYFLPDDSAGKSSFKVFIDGRQACVFEFDVQVAQNTK